MHSSQMGNLHSKHFFKKFLPVGISSVESHSGHFTQSQGHVNDHAFRITFSTCLFRESPSLLDVHSISNTYSITIYMNDNIHINIII